MLKLAAAVELALLCAAVLGYGHDVAMTARGFPIAGYVGALLPVCFVGLGALLGSVLAS